MIEKLKRMVSSGEHGYKYSCRLKEDCIWTLKYLPDGGAMIESPVTGEAYDLEYAEHLSYPFVYADQMTLDYSGYIFLRGTLPNTGIRWIEICPNGWQVRLWMEITDNDVLPF